MKNLILALVLVVFIISGCATGKAAFKSEDVMLLGENMLGFIDNNPSCEIPEIGLSVGKLELELQNGNAQGVYDALKDISSIYRSEHPCTGNTGFAVLVEEIDDL